MNRDIMRVRSRKRLRSVIDAIVRAAERHGGIHRLAMCGGKLKFRNSVATGHLYYNNAETGSTHVVKIEE